MLGRDGPLIGLFILDGEVPLHRFNQQNSMTANRWPLLELNALAFALNAGWSRSNSALTDELVSCVSYSADLFF